MSLMKLPLTMASDESTVMFPVLKRSAGLGMGADNPGVINEAHSSAARTNTNSIERTSIENLLGTGTGRGNNLLPRYAADWGMILCGLTGSPLQCLSFFFNLSSLSG